MEEKWEKRGKGQEDKGGKGTRWKGSEERGKEGNRYCNYRNEISIFWKLGKCKKMLLCTHGWWLIIFYLMKTQWILNIELVYKTMNTETIDEVS